MSVFVAQYFLIVVAPIPIAAAIYLVLTYAAKRFPNGHRLLLVRPNWIVGFFVFMDIATIAVQVAGAALVGVVQTRIAEKRKPPVTSKTAGNILLAGLAVQTASFTGFLIFLLVAIARSGRIGLDSRLLGRLRALLFLNLAAALLILLRTVYRLAVECQGTLSQRATTDAQATLVLQTPLRLCTPVLSTSLLFLLWPSSPLCLSRSSSLAPMRSLRGRSCTMERTRSRRSSVIREAGCWD